MTQQHIDLLTLKNYHLVISNITKLPYLNEKREAYLFASEKIFFEDLAKSTNTHLDDKKYYSATELCEMLYAIGALTILVFDEGEYAEIPIDTKIIKNDYYNSDLNYNLLSLKQTQEKKYLKALSKNKFIIPIYIDKRFPKQCTNSHYAYAILPGKTEKYYVLFSNLSEFYVWSEKNADKWKPLEINIRTLNNIRKKNPVIINPYGVKIILSHELLKKIPVKGEDDD